MMLLGFAGLGFAGYHQRRKLGPQRAPEDVLKTAAELPRRRSHGTGVQKSRLGCPSR